MKTFKICAICFIISFLVIDFVYAEKKSTGKTINSYIETIKNDEYVMKITNASKKCWAYIQIGWKNFKEWFGKIPGIKQYNESVYSGKNWEKTMNSMGKEYGPHLQKDGAGINMLKKGKKKWDNL